MTMHPVTVRPATAPLDPIPSRQYFGQTPVQIGKIALRVFSGLSFVTGAVILVKGTGEEKLMALPLVASAGGTLYWSSTLKDYQNPIELAVMRAEADWTCWTFLNTMPL